MLFLIYIILQIDPSGAVENISHNYGLLGSLFVIVLALLLAALLYISRNTKKQIVDLNQRLDEAEADAKQARDDLLLYVKNDHNILLETLKRETDSRDLMRVVVEMLISKV